MPTNKRKGVPPPRYDAAFKAGAIRLVTEQNRPCKEIAEELGICIDTLKSWLKAAGHASVTARPSTANPSRIRELEAENRALKKTLAEKEETIDVLKKSVGIFSKP
ncbi:transposase [Eubacteriales bacterium OttesenSCG-928-A19]|nr:transposase [Eubacteriales bacterium OttesenSCG-928-A19]